MSRARHRAMGGSTGEKPKAYDAGDTNVEKEAEEKKKGGRIKRREGGKVEGEKTHPRLDRVARKSGGRTGGGSNANPLSSASKMTQAADHKAEMGNAGGDNDGP